MTKEQQVNWVDLEAARTHFLRVIDETAKDLNAWYDLLEGQITDKQALSKQLVYKSVFSRSGLLVSFLPNADKRPTFAYIAPHSDPDYLALEFKTGLSAVRGEALVDKHLHALCKAGVLSEQERKQIFDLRQRNQKARKLLGAVRELRQYARNLKKENNT